MKFNEILRARRRLLKLTQQDLADIWGIKSINVSGWEKGKSMPEAARIPALAKKLKMTISELMGESIAAVELPPTTSLVEEFAELMRRYERSTVKGRLFIMDAADTAEKIPSSVTHGAANDQG